MEHDTLVKKRIVTYMQDVVMSSPIRYTSSDRITTAEELDALPVDTVVMDFMDEEPFKGRIASVVQKFDVGWIPVGVKHRSFTSEELVSVADELYYVVIYDPRNTVLEFFEN